MMETNRRYIPETANASAVATVSAKVTATASAAAAAAAASAVSEAIDSSIANNNVYNNYTQGTFFSLWKLFGAIGVCLGRLVCCGIVSVWQWMT